MKLKHQTETWIEEDAARKSLGAHSSSPMSNSNDSSPKIKKKMSMDSENKKASKKLKSIKSKSKKVLSDNPSKSDSMKRKRTKYNDLYDIETKFSVMERAERVLSSLADEFPSFVKCMLPSNVAYGFWLHLPKTFCSLHLPNYDSTIILVDEWGNEYKTTYLLYRHGLSAGWRGFSISHKLIKGDLLIFQLIEPCKLKVHIVRVHGVDVVDAAHCLMNLDALRRATDSNVAKMDTKKRKRAKKYTEHLLAASQSWESNRKKGKSSSPGFTLTVDSDEFGSKVVEGMM